MKRSTERKIYYILDIIYENPNEKFCKTTDSGGFKGEINI